MHDVFEASYFIVDHEFMSNYLLRLITDMRNILTRLDVEHDLIRIEIYKPPDFNFQSILNAIQMKSFQLIYADCF